MVMQARSSLQVSAAERSEEGCTRYVRREALQHRWRRLTGFVSHRLGQSIGKGGGEGCYLGMWSARGTALEGRGRIESSAASRYRAEGPGQQMN